MGIDACYGRVRYVLGGRADGEGGRGERKVIIINNIKIVVAITIYILSLIALYYI